MGGKKQASRDDQVTNGVEIRRWKDGHTTIRIHFYYRGVRCRETLNLEATRANLKYAERLRAEIINTAERGTFSYLEYFPNSKHARLFGNSSLKITIGELLIDYLAQIEQTQEFSTYHSYKKICDKHLIPTFGKLPIKELTPAILRNWIRKLKITAKTMRNILIPLRSVVAQPSPHFN